MSSKLLLVAAVLVALVVVVSHGLDLGHGGVYNDAAAQEYWNTRYGKDIFETARMAGKMWAKMENSNPAPSAAARQTGPAYIPKFTGTLGQPSPYWTDANLV